MKTILCFGDSNTWGQRPLKVFEKSRYPFETRWPGRLQLLLGSRARIIEEGLNGRTTGPEDPIREGRSARVYLPACIDSHVPLDLVILMLGSNDLKKKYGTTPEEIRDRMGVLVDLTKTLCSDPPAHTTQILLMPPVLKKLEFVYEDFQDPKIEEYGKRITILYKELAKQKGVHYFDASKVLEASNNDGVHLDPEVHLKFAESLVPVIERIVEL